MEQGISMKNVNAIKKLMVRVLILLGMILVCSISFGKTGTSISCSDGTYIVWTDKTATFKKLKSNWKSSKLSISYYAYYNFNKYSLTRIENECALGNNNLQTIDIEAKLTEGIGYAAFANCSNIQTVNFHEIVGVIGMQAFKNDSSLCYVKFPKCDRIETEAFAFCVNLQGIILPRVGYLGEKVFFHDTAVQYVIIDSLKACASNAFFGAESQVKTVTINSGVVGDLAFNKQPYLEKVFLGDGITYVGKQAFQDSKSLKDLYLGKKIETIEEEAFAGTAVPNITISQTCKNIGARALDCDNLACLTFEDGSSSVVLDGYAGGEQLQRLYLGRPVVYKSTDAENAFGTTHLKSVTFGANNDDWEKDTVINSMPYQQPTYESVNLDTVRVLRVIPPQAPKGGFSDYSYSNAVLLVPEESVELYQKDSIWGKFAHIGKFSQEISWEQDTIVTCKDLVTLTATASSGLPVQYRITDGSDKAEICQNNGLFQLKVNKSGSVTVEAYQSGDSTYKAAESASLRFTIIKLDNKITWNQDTTTLKVDEQCRMNASASSGQAVSFIITKGENLAKIVETKGKCTLKAMYGGTVTVAAIEQGNDIYEAADSVFKFFTITKKSQEIYWGTIPTTIKVGDSLRCDAYATSGLKVSYKITKGEELAEIVESDGKYFLKTYSGGKITVAAIERGNGLYEAADTVFKDFKITKYSQKITWTPAQTSIKVGESVALEASASSGQAVSYKITEGEGLAEIVETDGKHYLKANGAGSVTVAAIEPGNGTYAAADSVFKVFTISKYTQTITWTPAQTSLKAGESVALEATASSGQAVSYKITEGENLAEIVETEGKYALKGKGGGSVTVAAFVQGNELYEATDSVFTTFTITKKEQTITWKQDIEIVKGTTLTMQAVSSSGLPVTYTYQDPRPGTFGIPSSISGADIVFDSPGAYILYANQEGNDEYEAAEPVKMEFNVLDEAYDDLMYIDGIYYRYADDAKTSLRVVRGYKKYEGDIVVPEYANGLPVVKIDNNAFSHSFGITSIVIGDNVTSIGDQALALCINMTSITLPPSWSLGNINTLYCSSAIKEVHCKARVPNKITGGFFYLSVDYNTCILYVPRGTKELYAVADVWKDFVNIVEEGERAEQTLTWTQNKTNLKTGNSLLLSATASSGLAVTYRVISGTDNCAEIIPTDSGYVLMALAEGTVTVAASQAGNNAFNAANSVTMQFTITAKKKQTITWEQDIEIVKGTTLTMQAVSSSGLPVTYTYERPVWYINGKQILGDFTVPSSISGAEITFDSPGSYVLYANQEGNDEYEAAEPVKRVFNVLDEAYDDLMYIDGIYYRYADDTKTSLRVVRGYKKYEGDIVVPTHANSLPVVKIDDKAFYASYGINSVVVGDRVTSIGEQALGACQYLSSVTLPPVCSMPNRTYTFNSSPAIKEIHCKARTPYLVDETIFNGAMDYSTCILYVPRGTKELYAAAEEWKNFVNIVEEGERAEQAVTWTQSETALMVDDSLQLSASATSGLTVSYVIVDGNENAEIITTDSGALLHALKAGEVTVGAYQQGNNMYSAADTVTAQFVVSAKEKKKQTIAWEQDIEIVKGTTLTMQAVSSSGLPVTYTYEHPEGAFGIPTSISGAEIVFDYPGAYILYANQEGNDEYEAAEPVKMEFNVLDEAYDDLMYIDGIYYRYADANKNSLMVVRGYKKYEGDIVVPTHANSLPVVKIDDKAFYASYGINSVVVGDRVTSIGEQALGACQYLSSVTLSPVCSMPNRTYTFNSSPAIKEIHCKARTPYSVDESIFNGAMDYSTCILYVPRGTKELYAAADVWKNFVNIVEEGKRAEQAVTWTQSETALMVDDSLQLSASATSGLTVSYVIVDGNENAEILTEGSGAVLHALKAGEVTVGCYQEGNNIYLPSDTVCLHFTINKIAQTIEWHQQQTELTSGDTILLTAKASSGLSVKYKITNGEQYATIEQTDTTCMLRALGAGNVFVAAYQDGNNMYSATDTVTVLFVISAKEKKKQTIAWEQDIEIVKGTTLTMQAVSSSGLPVTYTYEHPEGAFGIPTSISGAEIVFDYPGAYILYANQEGNDEYEAAEPVKMEFNVLDEAYDDLMYIDGIYYRYADANKNSLMVVRGYKKYEGDIVVPTHANSLPVVKIDDKAFYASYGINSVVVGDRVTSIGEQALGACQYLSSVTLPPVCSMPNRTYTFNSSPAIKEIHCKARTPYLVDETIFNGAMDYSTCILYVPRGTKELYAAAEEWKNFVNIVEEGERAEQAVTWTQSETALMVGDSLQLSASATSGLPVNYTIVDGNENAEIITTDSGALLHALKAGEVTVAAYQQGNNMYSAADTVTAQFVISAKEKKKQTITWEQNIEIVKGTTLTMQAVSSSGLPVTYTYEHPEPAFGVPASISGAEIVFDYPGAYILYANQEGNDEYEAAEPVKMEFNVLDEAYDDLMYIDGIYYRYADANKNSLMVVSGYKKYEGDIVVPEYANSLPVVRIDGKAFYASYGINSVVVGDRVTSIGEQALGACQYLTSVTLPPVCSMPNRTYTFNSSPAIKEIHCRAITPYQVDETIFNGAMDYAACILYVPRGTKALYEKAEVWCHFTHIVEEDVDTGIYTVEYFDSEVDIYTLAGQLVRAKARNTKGLKPGVYVVRGKKIVAK